MKLALAQTRPRKGDIAANLAGHARFIAQAAAHRADLIVFPELSLTGYEPTLAKALAAHANDPRFDELQTLSDTHHITICAGMPTPGENGLHISLLLFSPGKPRQVYSKQQLFKDEMPFFVNGSADVWPDVDGKKIAPAICYESRLPDHTEKAARNGAHVYMASVARTAEHIAPAAAYYSEAAKRYGMFVCVANYVGPSDNFVSAGQSSAWDRNGKQLGQLGDSEEGLLIVDTETGDAVVV